MYPGHGKFIVSSAATHNKQRNKWRTWGHRRRRVGCLLGVRRSCGITATRLVKFPTPPRSSCRAHLSPLPTVWSFCFLVFLLPVYLQHRFYLCQPIDIVHLLTAPRWPYVLDGIGVENGHGGMGQDRIGDRPEGTAPQSITHEVWRNLGRSLSDVRYFLNEYWKTDRQKSCF